MTLTTQQPPAIHPEPQSSDALQNIDYLRIKKAALVFGRLIIN